MSDLQRPLSLLLRLFIGENSYFHLMYYCTQMTNLSSINNKQKMKKILFFMAAASLFTSTASAAGNLFSTR